MEILLLTTPTQHRSENPAVELNPKILQQWTRALPIADVVKTVEALSRAIEAFNELQIADRERSKLLDVYYEAFDRILPAYDELRLRQLPISDKARRALANDIVWLYLHLANGYKIIVNNTFQSKITPKLHPPCVTAIYRAMAMISQAALYAIRAHNPTPPLTYLELNQLYLFAQCADLVATPLRKLQQHNEAPTIAGLYKQFLLLVLSHPDEDSESCVFERYIAIERYASLASLTSQPPPAHGDNCYLIDYFEDRLPIRLNSKKQPVNNQQAILDIDPCLRAMQRWLQQTPTAADAVFYENERRLLPDVLHAFAQSSACNDDLKSNYFHDSIQLIFGLDQVLEYLNEGELPNPIPINSVINSNDCFEINTADSCSMAKTGDIVGLSKPGSADLSIMVLENIDHHNEQCTLKLRKITGRPEPVYYRLRKEANPLYGLYFPKSTANGHASLLTVKALLNHRAALMVSVRGNTYTVKTGESLLETDCYAQFRFKVIGKS